MFLAKNKFVLELLANDPEILPWVVPQGTDLDDAELTFDHCFDPLNSWRFLFYHNGVDDTDESATIGMLFQWSSPDVYELHMLSKPSARGGDAIAFACDVIADVFYNKGAIQIWGQTPMWNERARKMHRKVGGVSRGVNYSPAMLCDVEFFASTPEEWEANRPR